MIHVHDLYIKVKICRDTDKIITKTKMFRRLIPTSLAAKIFCFKIWVDVH